MYTFHAHQREDDTTTDKHQFEESAEQLNHDQ